MPKPLTVKKPLMRLPGTYAVKHNKLGLFCFSPAVMLGTFVIEIFFVVLVAARYKMNETGRLAVAILLFLAVFQLAEYNVCAGAWIDPQTASRLGFAAITMLPPLGLHMVYALGGVKKRQLVLLAYVLCAAFVAFFLFAPLALTGHACLGNYVIFQMYPGSELAYSLYYYGWMLVALGLLWRFSDGKKKNIKYALYGFGAGYVAFIVPTTFVNVVDRSTLAGVPSVMCGFAVLLAFVITWWVMPQAGTKR